MVSLLLFMTTFSYAKESTSHVKELLVYYKVFSKFLDII